MGLTSKIVCSSKYDPWLNLAVEDYLLKEVQPGQCILYLWQNQNTVVIGKHQNAWKECRTALLEEEGGKLARRLSGGGAVFHDLGNLNFTFLVAQALYDLPRQLDVILKAVQSLGIPAVFSGRNDLTVEGRKFSGNAFCARNYSALHHGTLLVSADLDKLTRYLQVSSDKIRSKGIESVRSRVVNLREYAPQLTIERMKESLIASFSHIYGASPQALSFEDVAGLENVRQLYQKYSSWGWRYGESPEFDVEWETRLSWGGITLDMQLENGRVKKIYVYSDAMDEELIARIPQVLNGFRFSSADFARSLRGMEATPEQKQMLEEMARWLEQKKL